MDSLSERRARAKLRLRNAVPQKGTIAVPGRDVVPPSGERAVALVAELTIEGWSEAVRVMPSYSRKDIPVRFVERGS